MLRKSKVGLAILIVLTFVAACGSSEPGPGTGGNNEENQADVTKLRGKVSYENTGIKSTLFLTDSRGQETTVTTGDDGTYTADLVGKVGPFIIKAVPDDPTYPELYSYTTGFGIANCNSVTSLAMMLASSTNLSNLVADWSNQATGFFTALKDSMAVINANLNTQIQDAGFEPRTFSFFSADYQAQAVNLGTLLSLFKVKLDYPARTFELVKPSGEVILIDVNIDISGYYVGALFVPSGFVWTYGTYTLDDNGKAVKHPLIDIGIDLVPMSREAWEQQIINAFSDALSIQVEFAGEPIEVTLTDLTTDYAVFGAGEPGTTIYATFYFIRRVKGTILGTPVDYSDIYGISVYYELN